MDIDSATRIITTGSFQWFRNYYDSPPSNYKSGQQELSEGKHYYMKIFHQDNSGEDHFTIGMSIEDESALKSNSKSEWKRLMIDPQHTYEQFEFMIPNHDSALFKIQFLHESRCPRLPKSNVLKDCVQHETCSCVTTAFNADTSANDFKNDIMYYFNKKVKEYYGDYLNIKKVTLDVAGEETDVEKDITTIKFTVQARKVLGSPSFDGVEVFSNVDSITPSGQMLKNSTVPLTGKFRIRVKRMDGRVVVTGDLILSSSAQVIKRTIAIAAPEYKNNLQIKRRNANFQTGEEGVEIIYRTTHGIDPELQILTSTDEPLLGGYIPREEDEEAYDEENEAPLDEEYKSSNIVITKGVYRAGSNAPFYESIPAEFLRTVETKPQITVKSNGRLSACPLETFCDIQFIDDVAEITSRSVSDSFADKIFDFVGTSIPKDELMYVSVGTLRTCDIDYGKTVSVNNLSCTLLNAMSGKHPVTVQTTKGALKNSASLGTWDLSIAVSSVSPTTIGPNGGRKITIEGDYFPLSLEEVSRIPDFSLTIGGNDCTLISIDRTKIICSSPTGFTVGSTPSLQLSFNSQSYTYGTTFTIQASAGSVTSVSPALVSPPIKQNVNIVVSDTPSSNPDDYVAVLEGPTNTVMMRVNSVDQSTKTLVARYPGSPDNIEYTLYIQHGDDLFDSNVKLQAMSAITGVSITTSGTTKSNISTSGGDIVVITGTGFSSTLSDNKVVFGKAEATVLSGSETELTVRAAYSQKTGDVDVQVFIKLSVESSCSMSNGCVINYDASQAPALDYMMSELTPSDGGIIIAGSGFGTNPRAFVSEHEQKIVASNSTEIEVELTKIDNIESFYVEVRTDTVNFPPVAVKLPMSQSLVSISPHIGSTGGEKLTLSTIGIGLKDSSAFDLYYKDNSNVVSVCETFTIIDSTKLTCITKHDLTISQKELKLSFSHKSVKTGKSSIRTLSCAASTNCQYETTTAATPTITSVSKTNGNTKLDVTIDNFSFDSTYTAKVYYGKQEVDSDTLSSTTVVTGSFSDGFTPGKATIRVALTKGDRTTFTASHQETVPLSASSSPITQCSWAGGCVLNIAQTSIKQGALNKEVSVSVCGNKASIGLDESTNDNLVVWTPPYATTHSLDDYKVSDAQVMTGTVTSNPVENGKLAFDGITSTQFTSNTNNCFVQVKFTDGRVGRLSKLKYFMNRMTDKQTNFVNKLKFQASSDGTAWTDVFAADIYLKEGWNEYKPNTSLKYQYYRFFSATKIACQVGEIELWGNEVEDTTASSKVCDVVVTAAGDQTQTFSNHVTYQDSASSVITGISPRYGTYKGGETVTFTGTGFSTTTSEATVTIDGITCTVTSATSTQIQCTTGARPTINSNPSTILTFSGATQNGHASMQTFSYKYANYWSDLDTWSGEFIPQEGDSVVIPKGQTLLVDVDSTPVLKAILVQGAIIFAPGADPTHHRTFDAEYIYVDKGAIFEAGTEDNRYTSKLTITMHGTRESIQLPVYGNKGIFVRYGQFDMHGVVRDYTWTELATTANVNSKSIALNVKADWKVGEKIVIAPTDFEVDHAEEREITAVDNSGTKTLLTLDRNLEYKHYSGSKSYTGSNGVNADMTKTLEMRAEVGLLTRNIVFKGADADSIKKRYGAHIMLHSPGDDSLTGRISYVELTQVGQAFQLGRYPLHFHMIGTVHNSYIKGNAIHHTYNRACTIHGVHYLTIENNVAYETMGHTFFIEDGAETKNLLKNNLAVKTKRSWSLLNTDQTPASFWITNPDNQFIGNHAAGSDRYGFWFDLQVHPTGPSFDPNICPEFEQLGEFTGNVAHSNGRYALRIFHRFVPTNNPCKALRSGAGSTTPIVAHFRDYLGYKNKRNGIIAEELGALKFHDVRVADNLLSGVEFGITSVGPWITSTDDYHLQDALIVGASDNAQTGMGGGSTRGLKGARSEKMRVKDTIFANFDYNSNFGAIGTCSHCTGNSADSSGRTYFFKNLYFVDTTQRVKFDYPYKEIIYDEDGTLGNSTHRWVVFYSKHLDVPECVRNEAVYNGLL